MFKKKSKTTAKLFTLFDRKKNKRPQKPDLSQAAILEAIERGDMD